MDYLNFNEVKDSNKAFIPYLLESKIKKELIIFLKEEGTVILLNGKVINSTDADAEYSLIMKVERLKAAELLILSDYLVDKGVQWCFDYVMGGLRIEGHLAPTETKQSYEIRNDSFLAFDGRSIF